MIVNVQRGGPGLGNIAAAQGDYFQATRGGGNGDYRTIVLAPDTAQEMLDFTFQAFDLADQYRTPVMILSDGRLGQMMEPVELRDPPAKKRVEKPWALAGAKGRAAALSSARSFCPCPNWPSTTASCRRSTARSSAASRAARRTRRPTPALVFVGYGTCARLCREATDILRDEGLKAGLFRPITLWPFPAKKLLAALTKARTLLVAEMSAGQMVEDVRMAVAGRLPIEFLGYTGGEAPSVKELVALGRKLLQKPHEEQTEQ